MIKKMTKKPTRLADKKEIFICQITETSLRVAKCQDNRFSQRKFLDFEFLNLAQGLDTKAISEKIREVFKKLGFNNNPVVVSLPRSSVTSRYLKVPSQTTEEIENMILLQAPRFLPYPAAELITGFEHIQTEKEGFSHINLTIAHKNVAERLIGFFQSLTIKNLNLTLSSYGLSALCNFLLPQEQEPVMLLDFEHPRVELIITVKGKLVFSRVFKMSDIDWQNNLVAELNKTKEAYLKEAPFKEPVKIIIPDHPRVSQKIEELLSSQMDLPVTRVNYQDGIPATDIFRKKIIQPDCSLAVLIGLGLKKFPESLNLLPREEKQLLKRQTKIKEKAKSVMLVIGLVGMLALGLRQSLANKELYLKKLRNELSNISKDAKGAVELEYRYQLLDKRKSAPSLILELISQLHDIIPQEILLSNFSYEEEEIILRGQAPEPKIVFEFVQKLQAAEAFKVFNIKIRYVTQKKIQTSAVADFEIVCSKEK